jgi:hypothetical protein
MTQVTHTREAGARAVQIVHVLLIDDGTPDSDQPEAYYHEALAQHAAQVEAEKMGLPVPVPSSWQESADGTHIESKAGDVVFTIWRCPVHEF